MDAVLLGIVAPGIENHSLAVLGDALHAAGLRYRVLSFAGFAGMDGMLREVLALRPRVCGVSLQTTEGMLASLAFTRLLRQRGFAGTIVVGGHVAALASEHILAAATGVDVVVELGGEDALVGLARGEDPLTLPGTVTRAGRGQTPIPVRPRAIRRVGLGEHLGFGTADLVASRGCEAHCGYCCISAASDAAARTGGARHESRAVSAIADELAELTARGARAFHFMDDNVLPLAPAAALAWARELRAALDARAVPPIAFSLQLRADVVTPEVAAALADAGLVRAYVGIDGYTAGQLRAIGRSAPATAGVTALAELSARGIYCVANALLVGPTIRFETIVAEIEGLAAVRHAPVHLLPIEARPGTVYHQRAAARGLIEGGPLWPVYRFEDPRTFRVGEVITGLPTRLAERSVPIALYDLAWALGVAQRLVPAARLDAVAATYAAVTAAWNADQIRILRLAVTAAASGPVAELLAREGPIVRAHDDALVARCDAALAEVERAVSAVQRRPVRAHVRGRVLNGVAFAMGLAAAACTPAAGRPPDAAIADTAPPDGLPACVDPARTAEDFMQPRFCACGGPEETTIVVTFDADGVAVAASAAPGHALPPELVKCFLHLLAPYCYPSLAGTQLVAATCHSWIA